jgi:hypothetical protein
LVNHIKNSTKRKINNIENRFNLNPTCIIFLILMCPLLNTKVFGGVATGNINAAEAEIATPPRK